MDNRKQLYQQRGISMCIEHTFDFVRVNISSWLFVSALLLVIPSIILAYMFTKCHFDVQSDEVGMISTFFQYYSYLPLIPIFLSLWASALTSYTLMSAYFDGRLPGQRLSLKETWKYMQANVWKTLILSIISAIFIFFMAQHVVFFLFATIIGIPLLLLAPTWIVEEKSISNAVSEAFRLGFSSWFKLFLMVLLIILLCLMMMMSVALPWSLYELLIESVWIPNGLTASSVFLIQVIELLLTALFFYVFFLMVSVVMLSCVYFYGSTSESIDDITLENDIENFENL